MLDHTGNGGTKDNPILVEEGPLLAATRDENGSDTDGYH